MTSKLIILQDKIRMAEKAAGRTPRSVALIAVSKVQPCSAIRPVLQAGHRLFGENRLQETAEKWPSLREEFPDIILHLIGPLQTKKTRQAVRLFDVIETLDREKLARQLARIFAEEGLRRDCYIQINVGREPQKAGILPEEAEAFIALCRDELKLPIVGLMCIPPAAEDPAPYFSLLKDMAYKAGLEKLSMGMSGDFEKAIAEGATSVRVGTALFGERVKTG